MIYRLRIYKAVPEKLPAFHEFFRDYLLPIQTRHGARLVGRWETDDQRVVAVWEYDDRGSYERIEAAVRADPASHDAQTHRASLGTLYGERDEIFMRSTVGPSR